MNLIYLHDEDLYNRPEVLQTLNLLQAKTVLDIGGSWNPWLGPHITHMFDQLNPRDNRAYPPDTFKDVTWFRGNINDYEDWIPIFNYVEQHGKFDFCNCTHTLEDVAYPEAALKYMPRVAKAGFIAVPSKYWELDRRQQFRGGVHHRWIFDTRDDKLILYPKINLIDYLNLFEHKKDLISEKGKTELRMFWKETINFEINNNDYLGPTFEHVVDMYERLLLNE